MRQAVHGRFWGELVSAIEPTPATCAGTTFISTLETSGAIAARDVEADPVDRDHPLGDARTRSRGR